MPRLMPARKQKLPLAASRVMRFPCSIMLKATGINRSLYQGEGFHASQHYRRARAPVVGSGADRLRGRAATGQARCPQRPDGAVLRISSGMGSVHAARMAVEDFGGKVLGRPIEVIFADHQNKPDIGANIARQWIETEGVTLILDVPNSAVGLAVREVTRTHDAVDINTGAATSDLTGKACSPHGVHWSFDTYGLAATIGQALVKQGGDSWLLHHRRLRIRACPRARHLGVRHGRRRQGGGRRAPSAQYRRLFVFPAAGAGLQGEDRRALERRRRHHQRDQAGRQNSAWAAKATSAWRRSCCSFPTPTPLASKRRRA